MQGHQTTVPPAGQDPDAQGDGEKNNGGDGDIQEHEDGNETVEHGAYASFEFLVRSVFAACFF